jgi:hypothetical protein
MCYACYISNLSRPPSFCRRNNTYACWTSKLWSPHYDASCIFLSLVSQYTNHQTVVVTLYSWGPRRASVQWWIKVPLAHTSHFAPHIAFMLLIIKCYSRDQIEVHEIGGACGTYRLQKNTHRNLVGNPEGKNSLEKISLDGRIILKCIWS